MKQTFRRLFISNRPKNPHELITSLFNIVVGSTQSTGFEKDVACRNQQSTPMLAL